MSSFSYFTNGIYLDSEIPLPELLPAMGYPRVAIKLGSVPDKLEDPVSCNPVQQVSLHQYLLQIDGVAKFFVPNKNEIIVQPYDGADPDSIRLFLLSTLLSIVLCKHDLLTLHAASLRVEGGAVLIAGPSTAGKSTLSFGLHQNGYELLNDDLSTISFDEGGRPLVYPGIARMKLAEYSLESYGFRVADFRRISKDVEKYNFPIQRLPETRPVPIKAVIFISFHTHHSIEKKGVDGLELFSYLKENTFRYELVKELRKTKVHFGHLSALMEKVPFVKVARPETVEPKDFAHFINEQVLPQYAC
ncbi:hypothetical protein V9K67_05685 [Paraflavisolibacter sp. H34]|uniref:hypothetical protein n=1 Tax=Huijunlia imazamoxiresistens TaxID=3127457 RepID=UPI003019EA97